MTPATLLHYNDTGELWPRSPSDDPEFGTAQAYQSALELRRLRLARGEVARGFKIGFTNSNIWPLYQVYAPIWGTVYDTTLTFCEGEGTVSLAHTCQPRIEPEAVFGIKSTPCANACLDELFDALDWIAPGFEIVQSHLPDWKFKAADTVADGALHARLLVGSRVPVSAIAGNAEELHLILGATQVELLRGGQKVEQGCGANVLSSPLMALQHFLTELRQCPGAPDLMPGDVVTTGTWTNAWPVQAGERWSGAFAPPLSRLSVEFR